MIKTSEHIDAVTIMDTKGNIISEQQGPNNNHIHIPELQAGVYILLVKLNGNVYFEKLVKH